MERKGGEVLSVRKEPKGREDLISPSFNKPIFVTEFVNAGKRAIIVSCYYCF